MRGHKLAITLVLCVLLCSLLAWTVNAKRQSPLVQAKAASSGEQAGTAAGDWLEPRGLNIIDMVGFVPEEYLEGVIISFTPGYGTLFYESGERIGNTVTVTATVSTRYIIDDKWTASMFGCLGQPARIDQWGSIAPATTMRVYNGDQDVTSQVSMWSYVPAGQTKPIRNPEQSEKLNLYRYWESNLLTTGDRFTPDGAFSIPANMGCELIIERQNYRELTAVFVAQVQPLASVEVVGTEEFTFYSYNGPGYFGHLTPLKSQLSAYGGRHNKFDLHIPAEADYFFLNFPRMEVDPYTAFPGNPYDNIDRPVGGTYRIWGPSTDHVNTMGMPLFGQWTDRDRADGKTYLPYFEAPNRLSCPEYLVPAGIAYNPCMVYGNCSAQFLDTLWNTPMTMTMVYLRVTRSSPDVSRIPLKMVGPNWYPWNAAAVDAEQGSAGAEEPLESDEPYKTTLDHTGTLTPRVYIPLILTPALPPDDPTGCPCGWFAPDGRMIDFTPRQ
jgi:hypothetical protein